MHGNNNALGAMMKALIFPFIRVDQVQRCNLQQEFIERGLRSSESASKSGEYYTAGQVLAELDDVLTAAQDKYVK
jgi:hypothetical protein